jgi:hypothetical protein
LSELNDPGAEAHEHRNAHKKWPEIAKINLAFRGAFLQFPNTTTVLIEQPCWRSFFFVVIAIALGLTHMWHEARIHRRKVAAESNTRSWRCARPSSSERRLSSPEALKRPSHTTFGPQCAKLSEAPTGAPPISAPEPKRFDSSRRHLLLRSLAEIPTLRSLDCLAVWEPAATDIRLGENASGSREQVDQLATERPPHGPLVPSVRLVDWVTTTAAVSRAVVTLDNRDNFGRDNIGGRDGGRDGTGRWDMEPPQPEFWLPFLLGSVGILLMLALIYWIVRRIERAIKGGNRERNQ